MEKEPINVNEEKMAVSRRTLLGASAAFAATAAAGSLAMPNIARADGHGKKIKIAFSTPFGGQDSFSGLVGGIKAGAEAVGADLTISDAAFDVKKQNDQISTLAASKPDALIILAMDPVGSSKSVDAATKAGVPVFLLNSYVPNATAVTLSMSDDYGMGELTARYMVDRLGGKGKIGVMNNNFNEIWAMRRMALQNVISEYPDIEIVSEWSFDATGKTTSRTAADSFLAAHDDLAAIWCAWDNAAMESSLAILSAGKADQIFTTGIDGGPAAFEVLRSGGPFSFTCAQTFFTQSYNLVKFAHQHANGIPVPRIVVNPVYAVDKALLDKSGPEADKYDELGVADKLGWVRAL